jgi:hypothetical protein
MNANIYELKEEMNYLRKKMKNCRSDKKYWEYYDKIEDLKTELFSIGGRL